MAAVDPRDDSLNRYIVSHYRYDEARRERRNVDVAAFDNEDEFWRELHGRSVQLDRDKQAGLAELQEHLHGMHKRPGQDQRSRLARRGYKSTPAKPARVRKRHGDPDIAQYGLRP